MSAYSIATRGLAGRKIPQGVLAPINTLLFGASEQGVWYDPSDLSTLFQDSAGTTPVTAVEQPVGKMLDKSGRGNHASQITTAKRPVYSRRVNLFTKTEDILDPAWDKNFATVQRLADNSGMAVHKIIGDATSSPKSIQQFSVAPAGSQIYMSAIVKAAGCNCAYIAIGASRATAVFNLVTVQAVLVYANGTNYSNPIASIAPAGDGEFKITFAVTAVSDVGSRRFGPAIDGNLEYTGDGASGITIRAVTLGDIANANLPYQRVNTATDYDADPAKFPAYLRPDGVDDALQTGNIDFTGTDKMTVWAGVTTTAGSPTGFIVESSSSAFSSNGAFALLAYSGGGLEFASRGTVLTDTVFNSSPPASPSIVSASFDIGGSRVTRRVNSQQSAITADQGAGQYGNYPLYFLARQGTTSFFNGRLYSLIVRGAQSSQSQIEATELYIKQKMRLP